MAVAEYAIFNMHDNATVSGYVGLMFQEFGVWETVAVHATTIPITFQRGQNTNIPWDSFAGFVGE